MIAIAFIQSCCEHVKRHFSMTLLVFAATASLNLQAQSSGVSAPAVSNPLVNNTAPIAQFGSPFQTAQRAPAQQTRVFVYRLANASYKNPVNIYLDGRFHTALLQSGYSEFCATPGRLAIQSVYDDAQKLHKGKETAGTTWSLQAGKTLYLRINEANPLDMSVLEIAPETAAKELPLTAAQIHMLSRAPAAKACEAPATLAVAALPVTAPPVLPDKTPKPVVPRSYALGADALFEFGKTELRVSGYNTIEVMAQRLQRDFLQVDRIRVVGHSDAIGKPARNKALSLARAKVVAHQLRDRGVIPLQGFRMEGQGSESLIRTDCPHKLTPASKLCHTPNRRVEILVYGAKN